MPCEIGHGIQFTPFDQCVHARGHDQVACRKARLSSNCECHGDTSIEGGGYGTPGVTGPPGGWMEKKENDGGPSAKSDQRMVNTAPEVGQPVAWPTRRITGRSESARWLARPPRPRRLS